MTRHWLNRSRFACLAWMWAACAFSVPCNAEQPEDGPEPKKVLQQMGNYLAKTPAFRLRADEYFDEVLTSGQKVQFSNRRSMSIRHPAHLAAESSGDAVSRKLWYDGQNLTLYNPNENVYGTVHLPGSLDSFLDYADEQYGISVPLADFLLSDPYEALVGGVQTSLYLGIRTVGGAECHHLAFTQETLDWQIWIETGDKPLPRKLVISYKQEPSQPQYVALLRDWELSPELSEQEFKFTPPQDAERIDVLPRGKAMPVESAKDDAIPKTED